MFTMGGDSVLHPLIESDTLVARRQDAGPILELNGAVYVVERTVLEATNRLITAGTVGYVMPRERSLDIDDALDLKLADILIGERI